MFRKFSRAENIKTQSKVKSSEQRGIRAAILDQYPALETHIEDLLPKKGDTIVCKCKDYIQIILDPEGEFMFFQCRNGPFIPTLRLLHKYPDILPKFQVDRGAIRFVLGGSNVMCPGFTHDDGDLPADLPVDAPVIIKAFGKKHAMAIGQVKMSKGDILEKNKIVAAAKAGVVAPVNVFLESGPTGMEPAQTGFFQALGIATKITKGSIEVIKQFPLAIAGEPVGSSQAVLMTKMGMKPFLYGLKVINYFDGESMIDVAVLDIEDADIRECFTKAMQRVAAVGLKIGYPVAPAVPHMFVNAFRNLVALAIEADLDFKEAADIKDRIANPDKYGGEIGRASCRERV